MTTAIKDVKGHFTKHLSYYLTGGTIAFAIIGPIILFAIMKLQIYFISLFGDNFSTGIDLAGQLGDQFGFLNAAFSLGAVLFIYLTYKNQRENHQREIDLMREQMKTETNSQYEQNELIRNQMKAQDDNYKKQEDARISHEQERHVFSLINYFKKSLNESLDSDNHHGSVSQLWSASNTIKIIRRELAENSKDAQNDDWLWIEIPKKMKPYFSNANYPHLISALNHFLPTYDYIKSLNKSTNISLYWRMLFSSLAEDDVMVVATYVISIWGKKREGYALNILNDFSKHGICNSTVKNNVREYYLSNS